MKYFLIAGEASGDLHGSNLISAIKRIDKDAEFQFWGGDLMTKAAGLQPNKHISELAFMGFWEVIVNIRSINNNFKDCKNQIGNFSPNAVIMIDYPGFNLRIAPFIKSLGIKTFYYISPKVWAWKKKRVFKIKKYIDQLYTILPFETEFYKKFNYKVNYVGNPIMDEIQHFKDNQNIKTTEKIIAILPGSREQEIKRMLPTMIKVAQEFENYKVVVAGAPNFDKAYYEKIIGNDNFEILFDKTYSILSSAEAALVTSGTATLETALLNIPQVVCYMANPVSYHIAKNLVNIKYISLVNLIMNKETVVELIQGDFNETRTKTELEKILIGGIKRKEILKDYKKLQELVGKSGASERAADLMVKNLKS
jgi:lipid-A-disaccharide synthase